MTDHRALNERLIGQLSADGHMCDPRWAGPLRATPRHLFVPARAYAIPGQCGGAEPRVIDRDVDPRSWWDAVYSDTAIVTQRDDGATDPATPAGLISGSVSAPSVVLPFLELLDPQPGKRVLEIGTGSGWTAALLSAVVGDHAVTTIEIDPQLAGAAVANLSAAGCAPQVLVGDGTDGWPAGAPYDRVHITCGASTVPHQWVKQLRPDGVAVLPWMPAGRTLGFKLKLTANRDQTATGTFHGRATYMMLRAQRDQPTWYPHHAGQAASSRSAFNPREVWQAGAGAELAILAAMPNVAILPKSDSGGGFSLLLAEACNPDGSWAACDRGTAPESSQVTQYGPRHLWDELETAYQQWIARGAPGPDRFGMTITAHNQLFWLDTPDQVVGHTFAVEELS